MNPANHLAPTLIALALVLGARTGSRAPSAPSQPSQPSQPSASSAVLAEQLRAAAWADDVPAALRLTLAHGADVDAEDSWNGTGLISPTEGGAATGDHVAAVEVLVALGADPQIAERRG